MLGTAKKPVCPEQKERAGDTEDVRVMTGRGVEEGGSHRGLEALGKAGLYPEWEGSLCRVRQSGEMILLLH